MVNDALHMSRTRAINPPNRRTQATPLPPFSDVGLISGSPSASLKMTDATRATCFQLRIPGDNATHDELRENNREIVNPHDGTSSNRPRTSVLHAFTSILNVCSGVTADERCSFGGAVGATRC